MPLMTAAVLRAMPTGAMAVENDVIPTAAGDQRIAKPGTDQ